jgi:hypothetical protein
VEEINEFLSGEMNLSALSVLSVIYLDESMLSISEADREWIVLIRRVACAMLAIRRCYHSLNEVDPMKLYLHVADIPGFPPLVFYQVVSQVVSCRRLLLLYYL